MKTPPPPAETSPGGGGTTVAPAVPVSVGVRRHREPGAAGTHKPCGESWAWGPGGPAGPGAPARPCSPGAPMGPGSPLLPCAGGESCHPQLRVSLNPRHPSILGALAPSCVCFPLKSQGTNSPPGAAQIPWHLCADPTRPCPLNMEPPPSESPRRCLRRSSRPSELSVREGEARLEGAGRGAVPRHGRGGWGAATGAPASCSSCLLACALNSEWPPHPSV